MESAGVLADGLMVAPEKLGVYRQAARTCQSVDYFECDVFGFRFDFLGFPSTLVFLTHPFVRPDSLYTSVNG